MRHRVFISHCEEDHAVALDICNRIERRGVRCWIAPRDIAVGEDFARRVMEAIEMSATFVIVLSRHSNDSHFVKAEAEAAFNGRVPIFPVRIENVEPEKGLKLFLSIRHRVDAFGAGRAEALDRFAQAVVRRAQGSRVPSAGAGQSGISVADVVRLVGPGARDFLAQWKRIDDGKARIAWSWEAFIGGVLWPFYRGMIALGIGLMLALALIVMIGGLIGNGVGGALTGFVIGWVLVALFAGLTGSAALRRHVYAGGAGRRPPNGLVRACGIASGVAAVLFAFAFSSSIGGGGQTVAPLKPADAPVIVAGAQSDGAARPGAADPVREQEQHAEDVAGAALIGAMVQQAADAQNAQDAQNALGSDPMASAADNMAYSSDLSGNTM